MLIVSFWVIGLSLVITLFNIHAILRDKLEDK